MIAIAASCLRDSRPAPAASRPTEASPSANDTPPLGVREDASPRGASAIMQPIRNASPYPNDASGLRALATDLVQAAAQRDHARVRALLAALVPLRDEVNVVLTFDGQRALADRLTRDASSRHLDDGTDRAMGFGAMTEVVVTSATGDEIAHDAPSAASFAPAVVRAGAVLRPLVRFYRVKLRDPASGATAVLETFVYVGTRWVYLPQPWPNLADAAP